MKFSELVELFLLDRRTRDCNLGSVQTYRQHCTLFVQWLENLGVADTSQFNASLSEKYLETLRTRDQLRRTGKLSSVTIHKRMKHLKTFFLWLVRKDYIDRDVLSSFPLPKSRKRLPKGLPPEQVAQLLSVPMSERDHAIICLMLDSGLRLSELAALLLDDVDLARGMVRVRHGKGDKERYALFGASASEVLRSWLTVRVSSLPNFFVNIHGEILTPGGVYKVVRRLALLAGFKTYPHALRHTFATEFLNAGGQVTDLQLLMGHEKIETTLVYAHVALDSMRRRFAGLSLVNRIEEGMKATSENQAMK